MEVGRGFINIYRTLQFFLYRRHRLGEMPPGIRCQLEHFRYDENHGDIVHPCVRYLEDGFEGHHWWMVYTPYYNGQASMENPILCYSDSAEKMPPNKWRFYALVSEKPKDGYNSDPTLFYKDGSLYVLWRENVSQNKTNYPYSRATFLAKVENGKVIRHNTPLLIAEQEPVDPECCPSIMKDSEENVIAYAMHLRFFSPKIRSLKGLLRKVVEKITLLLDFAGIYSQQKSYGIAIWKGDKELNRPFRYFKTVKFKNKNPLYRPWHMDFFDYKDRRYAIVQTNQCNADICLAWSLDKENFTFYNKPLITNNTINAVGIYKPCAGVINNTFYLYYTAQQLSDRRKNELFLTTCEFKELISKIE